MSKYELVLDDEAYIDCFKLYRIRALKDIPIYGVKAGDLGGYIQSEKNLCHMDDCWVEGKAFVYQEARIVEDAYVRGNNGRVSIGNGAIIESNARIDPKGSRSCFILDPVTIGKNALLRGNDSYLYVSLSRYFTYTFYKTVPGVVNYSDGAGLGNLDEFKEREGRDSFKNKVIINYIHSLAETYFHKNTFLLEE